MTKNDQEVANVEIFFVLRESNGLCLVCKTEIISFKER